MSNTDLNSLSPFEFSLFLHEEVKKQPGLPLLDAGRGNPNWTSPTPREAFFLLGEFATSELIFSQEENALGSQINSKQARLKLFEAFLSKRDTQGSRYWQHLLKHRDLIKGDFASWFDEACDAITGDNYPSPERVLDVAEGPLKRFMTKALFDENEVEFDVFPVEGGAAGICYAFDTLMNSHLLHKGDKIALFLPTFAPYVELPHLSSYMFEVVPIKAARVKVGDHVEYTYPDSELQKLCDPEIQLAVLVNPSNPNSNALNDENLETIKEIVTNKRPDLLFISDDVYGTFVPNFKSLFAVIPDNCLCLYSFSKYYGATGWRLGVLAVSKNNVMEKLIEKLPMHCKRKVSARYAPLMINDRLSFIDRLVADSRDITLNHVAGLSTPQQMMITLFSIYGIVQNGAHYQQLIMHLCHKREDRFFEVMELPSLRSEYDTAYYCDLNIINWASEHYNSEFAKYLETEWSTVDFLTELARKEHVILLRTAPFGSDLWSVRISLANLHTHEYGELGERIIHFVDQIYLKFLEQTK